MNKITTDFVGNETTSEVQSRLTSILQYWLGESALSGVTTWGGVRGLLNSVADAPHQIGSEELADSFMPKLNWLNDPYSVLLDTLFGASEPGVWLDPSDLSTMWQDAAGTTPVTAAGQPVGRVTDKSGRGNHASQPIAAARPTLAQDANGKYCLSFDGVDDFLVTPTITPGTDKVQVFAGLRKLSNLDLSIVETFVSSAAQDTIRAAQVTRYSGTVTGGNAYSSVQTQGATAPRYDVVSWLFDKAAATAETQTRIRLNGSLGAQEVFHIGPAMGDNFDALPMYIGSRGGVSRFFDGNLYGLAVRFGPNLDAAKIARVERFQAAKTGVTI